MTQRIIKILLAVMLAVVCCVSLRDLGGSGNYQGDFRIFYRAAQNRAVGINPYRGLPTAQTHGFIYPPYTLILFAPFTHLPFETAAHVYLYLHAAAALVAVGLMLKFLGPQRDIYFFPFVVLAFNTTLMLDLQWGNISAFEQLLIWLGMAAFLRQRNGWFCLCIVAAAAFKLTPLALLVLLLLRGRRGAAWMAGTLAAVVILLAADYAGQPALFREFLSCASSTAGSYEHGAINPALWPLVRDVLCGPRSGPGWAPTYLVGAVWCGIAVCIGLVSFKSFRRAQQRGIPDLDRLAIVLLCLLYALLMPRMKDYSYMLLLAPAYYLIKTSVRVEAVLPLILLVMVPTSATALQGVGLLAEFVQQYFPSLTALLLWALLCRRLREGEII